MPFRGRSLLQKAYVWTISGDKMRLGIDARMINSSGIGKVIENILRRLLTRHRDWEFFILGEKRELEKKYIYALDQVKIIECCSSIYSAYEQWELPRKIPSNLDVMWIPHYNVPVFYTGPLIVTIHDLAHLALPAINQNLLKKLYAKIMFQCVAYKAKKIVCISKFTINELQKYIGVDNKKIELVYNGVDDTWFHIDKKEHIYSVPYFIYVGNIKPHKNLYRLIDAYRMVSCMIKQDLLLVGKKDGFITGIDDINERIEGIEHRIRFTGYIEDDVLQRYVAQSDGLIFPSLYEGFGLPPLEAMAAGKKVLAAKIPAVEEVCEGAAIYFDPYNTEDMAEKIRLFADTDMPLNLLQKKARSYSWDTTVEKMEQIFLSVLQNR